MSQSMYCLKESEVNLLCRNNFSDLLNNFLTQKIRRISKSLISQDSTTYELLTHCPGHYLLSSGTRSKTYTLVARGYIYGPFESKCAKIICTSKPTSNKLIKL